MKDEIKEILDKLKDKNNHISHSMILLSIKETTTLYDYITNLQEERDKFKTRCYKALKLIRDNYGLLDKYGIDMLDDILTGGDDNE